MKITDDQDAVVRNQIRFGVRLEWRERAPDPLHLPNQPSAFKHADFMTNEIETLLACGAVTKTDRPPTCVFPLGVVPKPLSKKLRLILDMRLGNKQMPDIPFRMESIEDIRFLA